MKKITYTSALICLALALLLSTIAYAWLSDGGLSSPANISSNIRRSYFERGNGTADDPYVIARPVQLYYFSWLQYLGYFNNVEDGETLYFEVDPINLETYESINYLDMTGFTLPPIGTVEKPFIGNFNGNDNAIRNLTVSNEFGALRTPPAGLSGDGKNLGAAEIIGFFGVIGEIDGDYDFESSASQVYDLVIENITVKTQTDNALIGLVAGYVNGKVDKVGVVGSTIVIAEGTEPVTKDEVNITNNLSDYALIGYCTPECASTMYAVNIDFSDPSISNVYQVTPTAGGGTDNKWGGSINMEYIQKWLTALRNSSDTVDYVYQRTDIVYLNGKRVSIEHPTEDRKVATINTPDGSNFGSFVIAPSGYGTDHVNFVSGAQMVTEYRFEKTGEAATLFYITDGTNYLSFNGTSLNNTDKGSATEWYISNDAEGGIITTVYDGMVYYLNINNSNLTITAVDNETAINNYKNGNLPKWTVSDGNLMLNSQRLECSGETWKVVSNNNNTTKYLISSANNPGNYLIPNNYYNGVTNTTDITVAKNKAWTMGADGKISIVNGNTTYILGRIGNNLTLSSNSTTTWTFDSNNNTLKNGNYYLIYNGNWSASNRSNTSSYRPLIRTEVVEVHYYAQLSVSPETEAKKIAVEGGTSKIDNSTENVYYDENGKKTVTGAGITYFPLSATVDEKGYQVNSSNTGYIVGAEWDDDTSERDNQDGEPSNLRISKYGTENMTNATTPYVISHKTVNQLKQIPTNDAGNADKLKNTYGIFKYADCYKDYSGAVEEACFGLHFMDAPILKSNVTKITAHLRGIDPTDGNWKLLTIDDYEIPTNCIDFTLYDKGFINAFAGTYYKQQGFGQGAGTVNNSFFSLYQIFRNSDKTIREIKEIDKIYGSFIKDEYNNEYIDTNSDYYYIYKGDENSESEKAKLEKDGYTVIFDCEWITNTAEKFNGKGWGERQAYYFEIPVNDGEYAIGSTAGKTGAYLVYLDLAANAQVIERTRVDEKIVTDEYESTIPNGVSILEQNNAGYKEVDIDSENSAFVSIGEKQNGENWSGEANFSQSGNVITDTGAGHNAVFIGSGITLKDPGGTKTVEKENITKTITVETSTYYDNNLVTGEKTLTVIKKTTVVENGETSVSYTKDVTVTSLEGVVTNKPQETSTRDPLVPDVPDPKTGAPEVNLGDSIMNAYYVVSDPSKFALDFKFTLSGQEGATTSTYAISSTNTTGESVRLAVTLTALGAGKNYVYQFNGQTIGKNTDPLVVTVENQTEGN